MLAVKLFKFLSSDEFSTNFLYFVLKLFCKVFPLLNCKNYLIIHHEILMQLKLFPLNLGEQTQFHHLDHFLASCVIQN